MSGISAPKSFMVAAAALFLSMIPGAIALFQMNHRVVVYLALAQGVIYAIFAWLLWRERYRLSPEQSRRFFAYLLGFAIVMRGALLFATPHSTDIYRYVWDGRVQAAGINPYRYVPADPALANLRDWSIYMGVNRKEYAPTIYPPMAQIVYFLASRVSETVTMMKATMLAFEALAIWALVRLLAARRLPIVLASLYALHPLAIWEVAGSGHIDVVAVAFMMLALFAAERGRQGWAGAALAAGTLTKYLPFALTPAIYRRWDWKMPVAFAVTAAALTLPYLSAGKKIFGFLGGYADEEIGSGDGLYLAGFLKQLGFGAAALPAFLAIAAFVLFALTWRAGFRRNKDKPDLSGGFAIAVAFTVFFSPHYPWYFLWLVPFLCFFPWPSVYWLTLSATALYQLHWPPSLVSASVQYVPFAALLIIEQTNLLSPKEAPNGRALV